MEPAAKEIIAEIRKLRQLKKSVFESGSKWHEIASSSICLSADILLVPLYWLLSKSRPSASFPIEEYMSDSVADFDSKASTLIPLLIKKTAEIDTRFPSRPFQSYRTLLQKYLPVAI